MAFMAVLVKQARRRGTSYLFAYRPARGAKSTAAWRPIKSPKTAWTRAMALVEAKFGRRWRWHDLRAAYITHVALTSGPLAAQKLARHSDFKTTQAYIDVSAAVLRAAAEQASQRPALRAVKGGKR